MTEILRVNSARRGGRVYDLRHLDGSGYPATSGSASRDVQGGTFAAGAAAGYFNQGAGAGAGGARTLVMDARGLAMRVIAGGGAPGLAADMATMWNVPTTQAFSTLPAAYQARRRFTLSGLIEMAAASVNSVYGLGLHSVNNNLDTGGAGNAGVEVAYDPAVSVNWLVRYRVQPGVGVTVGPISNIPAISTAPVFVEMIYAETDTPTLVIRMNGLDILTLSGATMPIPAAALPTTVLGLAAWYGGGRAIGATNDGDMRVRKLRYLVEEFGA